MSKLAQLPRPGSPAPQPGKSSPWADLIAFLGVLTLGGVLMALGHVTAGSLATICAALGGLYTVWKRVRFSDGSSSRSDDEAAGQPDDHPD